MDFAGGPFDNIRPDNLDTKVNFSSIGGLKEHKRFLREIIIFPLMYPELFTKFNTRPARGILFHGPPGTGKTLIARALANECGRVCGKKISFFFRKGADVSNKYVGESERLLRLIFKTAKKMKPSIIFFDEIDALAPMRSSSEDSNHTNSLVATLLAEMDGVVDRGDVIVIGATNRPEALDPAVRRPGRFDRELYFPAPETEDRREILSIYTNGWDPCLSDDALNYIAKITVGYLGADLKALCSESVLKAIRRVYPQIYESDCKLVINAQMVEVTADDMIEAMANARPTGSRYSSLPARSLPFYTLSLLEDQLKNAAKLMEGIFPAQTNPSKTRIREETASAPSVFLVSGECAVLLLAPALLARIDHCFVKELSVSTFHEHCRTPFVHVIESLFEECYLSGQDSVIFIRDLQAVWKVMAKIDGTEVLLQHWNAIGKHRIFILAATENKFDDLPKSVQVLFPVYKNCIYRMRDPYEAEVTDFLRPVLTELPLVPPVESHFIAHPPLPKASPGPKETESEVIDRLYREYDSLRQLRSSLNKILNNLSKDVRFRFFKSLNDEMLPEYHEVIEKPMDLETMAKKRYYCAKDFLNDIDTICTNAVFYDMAKPHKAHRGFRQNALRLHIEAYSLSVDEVDPSIELECQLVAKKRQESGSNDDDEPSWSPDFYMSKLDGVAVADLIDSQMKTLKGSRKRRHSGRNKEFPIKRNRRDNTKRNFIIKDDSEPTTSRHIEEEKNESIISDKLSGFDGLPPSASPDSNTDNGASSSAQKPLDQLIIDAEQLKDILRSNVVPLLSIGLGALVDLHCQLSRTVNGYAKTFDRTKLPRDLSDIIARYVQHAKRGDS